MACPLHFPVAMTGGDGKYGAFGGVLGSTAGSVVAEKTVIVAVIGLVGALGFQVLGGGMGAAIGGDGAGGAESQTAARSTVAAPLASAQAGTEGEGDGSAERQGVPQAPAQNAASSSTSKSIHLGACDGASCTVTYTHTDGAVTKASIPTSRIPGLVEEALSRGVPVTSSFEGVTATAGESAGGAHSKTTRASGVSKEDGKSEDKGCGWNPVCAVASVARGATEKLTDAATTVRGGVLHAFRTIKNTVSLIGALRNRGPRPQDFSKQMDPSVVAQERLAYANAPSLATPNGTSYAHWALEGGSSAIKFDVEVLADPGSGGYMYFAPVVAQIDGQGFYLGMQTDLLDNHAGGVSRGAGFTFSRFSNQNADSARVGAGGFMELGSHEGPFAGVRMPSTLGPGVYSFSLTRRPSKGLQSADWFDLTVTNKSTKETIDVGSLRFERRDPKKPASLDANLPNNIARVDSFTELYLSNGTEPTNLKTSAVPVWDVRISKMRTDRGAPRTLETEYPLSPTAGNILYPFTNVQGESGSAARFTFGGDTQKTHAPVTVAPQN